MRTRLLLVAALFLTACGARNDLASGVGSGIENPDAGGGGGGSGGGVPMPEQLAQIGRDCAPNDGPAIGLVISGIGGCDTWNTPIPSLRVVIWDQGLLDLHAGGTVKIADDFSTGAEGFRFSSGGSSVKSVVEGSLFIETFVELQGATGTYDVTYEDMTTEQGSFSAPWCEGDTFCG